MSNLMMSPPKPKKIVHLLVKSPELLQAHNITTARQAVFVRNWQKFADRMGLHVAFTYLGFDTVTVSRLSVRRDDPLKLYYKPEYSFVHSLRKTTPKGGNRETLESLQFKWITEINECFGERFPSYQLWDRTFSNTIGNPIS